MRDVNSRGLIAVEQPIVGAEWLRSARRARQLAGVSLAWLCLKVAATATAGLLAGSTVLLGNGLYGAIEGLASVIVVWRFTGSRTLASTAERRAQRLIAVSFFLLAPYLAIAVLAGLLANTLFGIWWLDPLVALGIATLAVFEGRRAWRGEACGCPTCAPPEAASGLERPATR